MRQARLRRNGAILTSFVALLILLVSPVAADTPTEAQITGRTMGTTYSAIVGYDGDRFSQEDVKQKIDERLREINSLMSTYDPESELSRFNHSDSDDWFDVSPETATVVSSALDVAAKSGGAFDPTVGPLVNLWGFGPEGRRTEPPTDEEIEAARAAVGYQKVQVELDPPRIRKSNPKVYLDLSAVAKGYGSDAVIEYLTDEQQGVGCQYAMVEIGGEIATFETRPSGNAWRLGIERPTIDNRIVSKILEVANDKSIATSGDYRIFFESDGQRFSHTIDPRTGRPVAHQLTTVTVQADSCMQADAWATTLMVLGPQEGLAWANAQGIAALLVSRSEDKFVEQSTNEWGALKTKPVVSSEPVGSDDTRASEAESRGPQQANPLSYFLITLAVFGIAVVIMAVGVIFSNLRVRGTCGGLAGMQDEQGKTACELCTNPSPECSGKPQASESVADS